MTISRLSIHDGPIDRTKLEDAVSFIEETVAALEEGRGRLDGDSMIRIERPDGAPAIMMQRNWQVTDVIRLNVWEHRHRPVVNLAIKGCTGHPLHPDPPREELAQHSRAILETALPFLKDVRAPSDPVMNAVDERLHAIAALRAWHGMIVAPSVCGDVFHGSPVTAGTAEVTSLDHSTTDALWPDLPRLGVLSLDFPPSGSTGLTLDPYRLMLNPIDPVERLRLIATLPSGSTNNEETPE